MIPAAVQRQRDLNRQIAQFEGLVCETARQIVSHGVELDVDDVRQILRIKILYALQRYDAKRSQLPLRRFIFGCVANMRKDIENRPRRFNSSIDQLREQHEHGRAYWPDTFDARYLSSTAEDIFFEVEDEEPAWMSDLAEVERQVVRLRSDGLTLAQIELELDLGRGRARFVMQSVREKLTDWRDPGVGLRSAPMPPLPGAGTQIAPPRLARAA